MIWFISVLLVVGLIALSFTRFGKLCLAPVVRVPGKDRTLSYGIHGVSCDIKTLHGPGYGVGKFLQYGGIWCATPEGVFYWAPRVGGFTGGDGWDIFQGWKYMWIPRNVAWVRSIIFGKY